MNDPSRQIHPLWGILLLSVVLVWLTFTLWLQAVRFDSTEGKAIALIVSPLLVGWAAWFYRYYGPKR